MMTKENKFAEIHTQNAYIRKYKLTNPLYLSKLNL